MKPPPHPLDGNAASRRPAWPMLILKATVTLALLALLASQINGPALGAAMRQGDAVSILLATALITLQGLVLGWRWHRVIGHLGGRCPVWPAIVWTQVGIFFNQALPSSVGGDAMRIWLLHKHAGASGSLAASSVIVERVTGLVLLSMLVSLAAWSTASDGSAWIVLRWVGPAILSAVALALVLGRWLGVRLPPKFSGILLGQVDAFTRLAGHRAALLELSALGVAAALSGLLAAWVMGQAMGIQASVTTYIALVGGAVLLAVLPVSLGGWGVREAGAVALFSTVGFPPEPVVALSLLWALLPVVVALPFALTWWLSRPPTDAVKPAG